MNSAICEEISKFCPNVSQWENWFSTYYPQISNSEISSEIYLLFSQCSQLVGYNSIDTLKDNIGNNHISTQVELTND